MEHARKSDSRSSREAIDKRRAARRFNEVLAAGGRGPALDGRTEKRRKRLLSELADGAAKAGRQALKPIDVLVRVQDLLALGEPLASIKKVRRVPKPVDETEALVDGVRRLHDAYGFSTDVYQFVGVSAAVLARAGVLEAAPKARGVARARAKAEARPGVRAAAGRSQRSRRGAA